MPSKLEKFQFLKLLKETSEVFEAELPSSKALADTKIEQRWSRSKALEYEKHRMRDYYDDFCIEISLICVPLESQNTQLSTSEELWVIVEPLMALLESLVTTKLRPKRPSSFAYPCLRALGSKLKQSRKRGETINTLDHDNSGLVEFKIDPWDHESSLRTLRRCRKKIVGLIDFDSSLTSTLQPAELGDQYLKGSKSTDSFTDQIHKIEKTVLPAFRSCSRTEFEIRQHLALVALPGTTKSHTGLMLSYHGQRYGQRYVEAQLEAIRRVRFTTPFLENEPEVLGTVGRRLCDLLSDCPIGSLCILRPVTDPTSHLPLWTARIQALSRLHNPKFASVFDLFSRGYSFSQDAKLPLMILLARRLMEISASYPRLGRFKYDIFFHVLSDTDDEINVDLENPFFGVHPASGPLQNSSVLQNQGAQFDDCFHSHRFMLELGVLLLEVQYGQSIEDLSDREHAGDPPGRCGYDDYITAWRKAEQASFEKAVGRRRAAAIRACLRCDFFPVDLPPGSDTLLRLAYQNIVRPLELEQLLSDDEVAEVPDLEDEEDEDQPSDAETTTAAPVEFMSLPTDGSGKWRVFDEQPFSNEQIQSADSWFQQLNEFLDRVMHPLLESQKYQSSCDKRTKIAVLDTGIDLRNGYIRSQKDRIKEMRNWVPNEKDSVILEDIADSFGHGTHIAGLVLKAAPCAEICVGRIASGKLLHKGEEYIAEAIVWASETCKADIISMSFGFPRSSDIVEEAIIRAHAKGTIMFAATRNDGGNKAIAYPANHHNVIGIASSDGLGNGSKFNPNAPDDDGSFFSTLGEAVESSWPRLPCTDENDKPTLTGSKRRKSGTSFATPIAAGLAANILDYARLELDMGDKYLKRLHRFSKMLSVLKLMAPKKRNGYRYMAPWLQWTSDEYALQEDLERERHTIRLNILNELNK